MSIPIVRHTPVPLSTRGPLYGEEFNAAHTGTNQNGERDDRLNLQEGLIWVLAQSAGILPILYKSSLK
ncbi:hypothetical protein L915_10189 [Phytophthora nicotianae]|uniref:Uncharacterized protein n=1 Tax=Phytophthora nicotianae TaxID=4792 RepID=W2GPI2_PHYNI|nr:hypothetical protein L915_10189 [Phytophthora nicotianae]